MLMRIPEHALQHMKNKHGLYRGKIKRCVRKNENENNYCRFFLEVGILN